MMRILSLFLPGLFKTIDKVIDNKADAEKIKGELQMAVMNGQASELEGAVKIIVAEAQGKDWLQRNWRPMLMLTIVAIIANNYLLAPYAQVIFGVGLQLDLPPELFTLMNIGVGGYVMGRTGEKMIKTFKQK